MEKIKILHICQAPIGGVVEYLRLFFENCSRDKFEHELIAPSTGNIIKIISKTGTKVHNIEMIREISPLVDLKHILELRKKIKEIDPSIVYCHSSKGGVLGRIASLGLGKKIFYNPHGWAFTMNCSKKKKKIYGFIERLMASITDKIINISTDEYEKALEYGLSKKKMVIINNGIDVEKYSDNIKEKYLDRFVIGFVGRLSEQKNPLFLVELAKEVVKEIPEALFKVVGNGELRSEMEKKIKDNDLEKTFHFVGWTNNVETKIKNFDVALMVSKWEGFGLVVCEYMAAKKPVIGVEVGGVKNIIEHKNMGLLSKTYDSKEISENIKELYKNKEKKNKIIKKGYQQIGIKFLIDKVIKKHEKLFQEILEIHKR